MSSEKTEEPSPRKLRKAREKGDVAVSNYASTSFAFIIALSLLPSTALAITARIIELLKQAIAHAADKTPVVTVDAGGIANDILGLTMPLLIGVAVTGAVAGVVQSGGVFSFKTLDFAKLNVFEGMKRLVSPTGFFSAFRSLAGSLLVLWLVYRNLRGHLLDIANTAGRLEYVGVLASTLSRSIAWDASLVGLGLGLIDLLLQRQQWLKRMRMTKSEAKQDHKESEGNPENKHARERIQHETMAEFEMLQLTKTATLVVYGRDTATALRYQEGDEAPTVVAGGAGELGKQIRLTAAAAGIPVVWDPTLAEDLRGVESEIPEDLFESVARAMQE